jgi:hypothetical protein
MGEANVQFLPLLQRGRTISGGTSLSYVLLLARLNNLERSWLRTDLRRWPGIYDKTAIGRGTYRLMVKQR